jgi:feruloyl-CoA synthase
LTKAAFDAEGFYLIGDAGRFADAADPARGIEFDGRIAEDFKLMSGTWVHVGGLRVKGIAALAPVAQDIVVTGHDRKDVGFLVFPNVPACRALCRGLAADATLAQVFSDSRVRSAVRAGLLALERADSGTSTFATRVLLMEEAPSIDAGEITDKGYINQRAVLTRRDALVEQLYAGTPGADVIPLPRDS